MSLVKPRTFSKRRSRVQEVPSYSSPTSIFIINESHLRYVKVFGIRSLDENGLVSGEIQNPDTDTFFLCDIGFLIEKSGNVGGTIRIESHKIITDGEVWWWCQSLSSRFNSIDKYFVFDKEDRTRYLKPIIGRKNFNENDLNKIDRIRSEENSGRMQHVLSSDYKNINKLPDKLTIHDKELIGKAIRDYGERLKDEKLP